MIELIQPIFITFWGIICFYGILDLCVDLNFRVCSCCRRRIKLKSIYLINKDPEKYTDKICPICLEDFDEENIPYVISSCGNDNHPFHTDCILKHYKNGSFNCPVCRRSTIVEI